MIIDFAEGKLIVRHPSGHVDSYDKGYVKQLKATLEQELIELKVEIARYGIYLKSMSVTKPTLLARAFAKLRKIV